MSCPAISNLAREQVKIGSTVERVASAELPTDFGGFRIIGYQSLVSAEEFIVLVKGDIDNTSPVNINIHLQCLAGDVFGSLTCDCHKRLRAALKRIDNEKSGVVIYQQEPHASVTTVVDELTSSNDELRSAGVRQRHFEQSAEILLDLGITNVKLIYSSAEALPVLDRFGLKVESSITLVQ